MNSQRMSVVFWKGSKSVRPRLNLPSFGIVKNLHYEKKQITSK
jgi:hypothetical protein